MRDEPAEVASARMRANRSRNTAPEIAFRRALCAAGLTGYRLHVNIAGRPDIVFRLARLAVFVNGCFWHDCPTCGRKRPRRNAAFWDAKLRRNVQRDAENVRLLEESGWQTMTVWECEIRTNAAAAAERVRSYIASSSGSCRTTTSI